MQLCEPDAGGLTRPWRPVPPRGTPQGVRCGALGPGPTCPRTTPTAWAPTRRFRATAARGAPLASTLGRWTEPAVPDAPVKRVPVAGLGAEQLQSTEEEGAFSTFCAEVDDDLDVVASKIEDADDVEDDLSLHRSYCLRRHVHRPHVHTKDSLGHESNRHRHDPHEHTARTVTPRTATTLTCTA